MGFNYAPIIRRSPRYVKTTQNQQKQPPAAPDHHEMLQKPKSGAMSQTAHELPQTT
jgi:hypothetical protein